MYAHKGTKRTRDKGQRGKMGTATPSLLDRILGRLTYLQKFFVMTFFYLMSLLIAIYIVYELQDSKMQFISQEIAGNQFINQVNILVNGIAQHETLVNRYVGGDAAVKEKIVVLQLQITNHFRRLFDSTTGYDGLVRKESFDDFQKDLENVSLVEIERNWNDYASKVFSSDFVQSTSIHQKTVDQLSNLIETVGYSSKLIYGNRPASFYYATILIHILPTGSNVLFLITDELTELFKKKDFSLAQKIPLIESLGRLNANLAYLKSAIEKTHYRETEASSNFIAQSTETYANYEKYIRELTALVSSKVILPNKPLLDPEIDNLISKVLNKNFSLKETTSAQLDLILRAHLQSAKKTLLWSVAAMVVSSVAALLIGYYIMRGISIPLKGLMHAAKTFSSGDMSIRIPVTNNDEASQLGAAFNQMADSFQAVIGQLQWAGIQLATSSTEIAAAAKQQETTVIEQESTTKEIAVTAKEIFSTAKDFAKTMSEVSSSAEQTSSLAASGKEGLSKMEDIMRQMVEASSTIASKLSILNEKASTITTVITTISKVADQTNLLSLNAAIEAEKAGEHGRSFAVIAREIRRLADQTANATLDIEKMVTEIVSAVSAGVMSVDKFSEEISCGVGQAVVVSGQLSKIIGQVQLQTSSFEAVNQGMQAQSVGAEQISQSIVQLSEAAQQTTASIRQFHKAIEQLNHAAQEMQTAVAKIKR